jgi:hypothetical protein
VPRAFISPATWGGVDAERGGHAPNILSERRRRVEAAAANRSTLQPAGTPPQQPEQEKAAVRPAAKVIDNASDHYAARPA